MECGLIGLPLGHSFSPRIHAQLANYAYELRELGAEELAPFFAARAFRGVNVTIPYKKAVIPLLDALSPGAAEIGSVNTVVNEGGKLTGYNTDVDGFLYLARRTGVSFEGRKVLILGSGGTSLTAGAAVRREGAREIVTVSRRGPVTYDDLAAHRDAEVIVNTTPVGMYPNNGERLLSLADFPKCRGVLDVIYNPLRTPLVLEAEAKGIPASGGLPMLVGQAAEAARLFAGEGVPEARVERVTETFTRELTSVVLIGMPGSGKSSVGEAVAELLDRPFLDTDSEFERRFGPVPDYIEREGEAAFRARESEVVCDLGRRTGVVLATGGGVPLAAENRAALRQNGEIFLLERELSALATEGRPLSKNLEMLYEKRLPVYLACAGHRVRNEGIARAAEEIAAHFKEGEKL